MKFSLKVIYCLSLIFFYSNLYGQISRVGEIAKFHSKIELISFNDTTTSNLNYDSILNYNKPIAIFFWVSTCGPCIKELNQVNLLEEFKSVQNKAKVIIVSDDHPKKYAAARAIAKKNQWQFDMYFDKKYMLRNSLLNHWYGVPQVMILDKNKEIKLHKFGYRKGDEKKILAQIKLLTN